MREIRRVDVSPDQGHWVSTRFLFPLLYLIVVIALGRVLPLISEPAGRKEPAECKLLLQQYCFSLATSQLFPES